MLDLLELLMPQRCVLCKAKGSGLCLGCLVGLPPAPDLAPPPGFSHFASLFSYEGDTRTLIASVKFHSRRDAIELPSKVMTQLVDWPVDCVTWAPTSLQRRRQRGFDQAELIARVISKELRIPCVASLRRVPGRGHQTGRSRAERLTGTEFTYDGSPDLVKNTDSILLVDDIRTTGATLCAAGDTLLEAGFSAITAATLAVTP